MKGERHGEHHKVAVVTGSALNIGRATALALARDGFRVMVTARSSADDCARTAAMIRRAQPAVAHAPSGAVRHLDVLQMVARVREQIVVAAMVVVHVRQDHVAHVSRLDTDRFQSDGR